MSMAAVAIGTAAVGIAEFGIGASKASKAKKEAAHLEQTRPKASISGQIKDDLSLAESDLSNGISSKALQAYTEQQDKGMSTGISAIQRMGGSANNIGDLFGKSLEGAGSLAMIQEQSRQQKVANLVRARQSYANEEEKVFEFNEWKPWADEVQANAQAKQAASNMEMAGINTVVSAGTSYAGAKGSANALDKANSQQLAMMKEYLGKYGQNKETPTPSESIVPSMFNKVVTPDAPQTYKGGYNFNNYIIN